MSSEDLNNLSKKLRDLDIIVLNTKSDSIMFAIAHVIRNYARTIFCIDPTYIISECDEGIRMAEDGKVYLIKGDYERDKDNLDKKIKSLGGDPKYVFGGRKL
jgi:hypothetical protein